MVIPTASIDMLSHCVDFLILSILNPMYIYSMHVNNNDDSDDFFKQLYVFEALCYCVIRHSFKTGGGGSRLG